MVLRCDGMGMYLSVSSVRVTVRGCSMVQSLDGCTGMYRMVRLTVKDTSGVVRETVETSTKGTRLQYTGWSGHTNNFDTLSTV